MHGKVTWQLHHDEMRMIRHVCGVTLTDSLS